MEERVKGIIKCYFVLNKGKWISAKEISEFLQGNDFKLGKLGKGLSSAKVSNLLKKNYFLGKMMVLMRGRFIFW